MCKYKGLILNMQVTKGFISQAYSNLLKLKKGSISTSLYVIQQYI